MISIQNLDPQLPVTGKKMGKQTTFLASFAKSPKDVSISTLVSLRITGSKYRKESFKPPVFGSNFFIPQYYQQ